MIAVRALPLALLSATVLVACGGAGNNPLAGHSDHAIVCAQGDRRTCDCGGQAGTQACLETGEGFEPCVCGVDVPDGGLPSIGAPPTGGCGVCDGCCRGSTCIPFDAETGSACGKRGAACSSCGDGAVCDTGTGTCVQPTSGVCNQATCPNGCCSPDGCVTDPNWAQCGQGGHACGTCPIGGTQCESDGTCKNNYVDPQEYFYISVRSLQVAAQTPSGGDWDAWVIGHTAPDPMVCLDYVDTRDGTSVMRTACTQPCQDTTSCTLGRSDGLLKYCYQLSTCLFCSSPPTVCDPVLFSGRAIQQGDIALSVYDADSLNSNDLMGQASLPATRALTGGLYGTGGFGSVGQVQYEILYTLP